MTSLLNIQQVIESGELTMTSLEVSELLGKRHDVVFVKIKELSEKGVIRAFPEIMEKVIGIGELSYLPLRRIGL